MDPNTGHSVRVLTRSQNAKSNEDTNSLTDSVDWLPADNDKLKKAQSQDEISLVHPWLDQDIHPDWKDISHLFPNIKYYWAICLTLQNGLVYRYYFHDTVGNETYLLLLPKSQKRG